jgi:hypothetical protein
VRPRGRETAGSPVPGRKDGRGSGANRGPSVTKRDTMDGLPKRGQGVEPSDALPKREAEALFAATVRKMLNSPPKGREKKGPRRANGVTPVLPLRKAGD